MRVSTPDIMALEEVRIANEAGRAVMVFDPALASVRFANTIAVALFGAGPDDGAPERAPAFARQLKTVEPILREDGEAMLRLKATAGDVAVWITAHVLLLDHEGGEPLALLTAPSPLRPAEGPDDLAARLFAEARVEGAFALGRRSDPRRETFGAAVDAFLDGDTNVAEEAGLRLWRIASDLALVLPQPAAEPESRSQIGALIERWRSRDGGERAASEPEPEIVSEAAPVPEPEAERPFVADLSVEPVRFAWRIDAEGRFSEVSAEFAGVVGPAAADIVGTPFEDVAEAFGFDGSGEIAGLLERRDTWSGRSVLWPVEGTDRRVVVDLAALPVYGRDRGFEGFRGFGVVRPREHSADPDAVGLLLAGREPPAPNASDDAGGAHGPSMPPERANGPVAESFGRRLAPPRAAKPAEPRQGPETHLSDAERDAFAAIGAELAPSADLPAPVNARPAPPDGDPIAPIVAAIPVPLLAESQGRPVACNAAFLELTGYVDLAGLEAAGGLDALFNDAAAGEEGVELNRADGTRTRARVQMQRARVPGRSLLIFTFIAPTPASDEAIREEADELRSVLDTATDGILFLHPSGTIRSMNGSAEALFGVGTGSYEGRPFTDLLAAESRRPAGDYLESLRHEGLAGILNDGREVMAEVAGRGAIPLFITVGRLPQERGWCVVLRDIAHWKRAEADLVAARRQAEDASLTKSRFLANISHELRTPLNAIIGFAEVMASETYGPVGHERYMEYLGDIKRSGHHVLELVNDLLDISKIEAGKVELAFESIALNEIVSEVVSLMQPQANRERVIVRSNLPAGIPPVVADRRTLRQIALNLVSNAIRFTPAGGQIIASTSYGEDGEVALRFRDSGIGMTDREIEIALTPFQQVNSASKERGDGTGLGLPLTKAMVEANRALFRIASTPGEGTLIEITFPAQRVLAH